MFVCKSCFHRQEVCPFTRESSFWSENKKRATPSNIYFYPPPTICPFHINAPPATFLLEFVFLHTFLYSFNFILLFSYSSFFVHIFLFLYPYPRKCVRYFSKLFTKLFTSISIGRQTRNWLIVKSLTPSLKRWLSRPLACGIFGHSEKLESVNC
jgi:hypothetical protein